MAEIILNSSVWMGQFLNFKPHTPIIDLAIPGSHNTFSYSITPHSDVSPDTPAFLQTLSRFFSFIVNPTIYKWSKTQNVNVQTQLERGIRYLDIRVVCRNNVLYVAHGLYGGELLPYLYEINDFLVKHELEVVFLDFQHFYNFTDQAHDQLISHLDKIFSYKLCPKTMWNSKLSLGEMIVNKRQIITTYRSLKERNETWLWPSDIFPTPWPNKIKVSELIPFLENTLKTRKKGVGLVTQCLLTVDIKYVLTHPFMNLNKLALRTNKEMAPWIRAQKPGSHGPNIIIGDFTDENFVRDVLNLNYNN